ncbi:MAG: N-acetylmuramoyl-L-alanine amidase [Thermoleophilia bacterium]|nr:N-acetylmuramoyl-L-alanine amidase [Thermoleophilia bacterium]
MDPVRTPRLRWSLAALVFVAACTSTALSPELHAAVTRPPAVVLRTVDVGDVHARARTSALRLPIHAELVGATWSGPARGLQLRTREHGGRWTSWTDLADDGDGPDPGSAEARALRGRHAVSTPLWVGGADEVQLRPDRQAGVRAVELTALNVSGTSTPRARATGRMRALAGAVLGAGEPTLARATALAPGIRSRSAWGAAPARNPAIYADAARGVVIHHTDSTNSYACSQVPALLRGFQRYHQRTMGWNDIGYNFLVDRCGGVWEGRAGGLTRAVIGAHTAGFNTGTVGISLIGDFTKVGPTKAALLATERLISWRMDVAHVNPAGTMQLTARSSDKFPTGTVVTTPAVVGHRDLYPTSCPGYFTYRQRATIAAVAARLGGEKVTGIVTTPTTDPETGELSGLTVTARTNATTATSAIVVERASTSAVLATRSLTGRALSATFTDSDLRAPDGALPPEWDVRVRVTSSLGAQVARPAIVLLGAEYGTDPGFRVVTPAEAQVSPAAAPPANHVHVGYTLRIGASVGAWLRSVDTDERVATLRQPRAVPATATGAVLDLAIPADVPAGSYVLEVGVESDPAPGRSIVRSPITIVQ